MDVDEVEVEIEVTPAPDEQAHLVLATQFQPFPFTHDVRNAMFARRSLMSDELLFDHLLEKASIASPQSLFPPDSPETLLDLLDAIAKCSWDSLKKSCLYFYLLSYVSSYVAADYAATWALPPQFVHLAHACFFLDSGTPDHLAHAVALLSDARIIPDLASKVLHTLSLAPQPESSRLVRAYVRTAQPVLEEYEDLAIYIRALLECSLADAWTFQRTFSETTPLRNQLFRTILDGCLIPPKPSVLPHLLSLPLTTFEFSLLQSYALSPPEELTPSAHSILQDLITVRLLHSGKYSDAIRLSRAFDTLNAKSYAGNASLHKAAEDRQQMMRDVLAVVPEVQSRQLELEFTDEQADGEAVALGGSWMSMGSDVTMSWENLGASGGAKVRERSHSGRLEGSPAVKLPGRPNAPNTPFGLFSSPGNSAQKSRIRADASTNIFGTPTPGRPMAPVLPTIPTPGLDASMASGTPLTLSGFRPQLRQSLGVSPVQPSQPAQNGAGLRLALGLGSASAAASGTRVNIGSALHESERLRASPSLFGRQAQGETGNMFAAPRMRQVSGDGDGRASNERFGRSASASGTQAVVADTTMVDDEERAQHPTEDVVMVDSDDPDGFVVHGRRRTSFRPATTRAHTGDADAGLDAEAGARSASGAHTNGTSTTFFGREDAVPKRGVVQRQRDASPQSRVLPGGYISFDQIQNEGASGLPRPPTPTRAATAATTTQHRSHAQPRRGTSPPRSSHTRTRGTGLQPDAQQLKIPGALFEDPSPSPDAEHEEDDDAGEEQDNVPSLPSLPSGPSKAGRRTRSSRASSVATESGDDEDAPKKSLRRSSRLSSAGLSSPEPTSPQKPTSKRSSRAPDGTGRSKRKRKDASR